MRENTILHNKLYRIGDKDDPNAIYFDPDEDWFQCHFNAGTKIVYFDDIIIKRIDNGQK